MVRTRPNRRGVIDIGTNTVNLLVCDVDAEAGTYVVVEDTSEVTRLGQDMERGGSIQTSAADRTCATIRRYAVQARRLGASEVTGVGTSVLRDAANTPAFLELVRSGCQLDVNVIPSAAEARLSYLSVRLDEKFPANRADTLIVADAGSGSTEFVFGRFVPGQRELDTYLSINMGAVHLTSRFLRSDPPTSGEMSDLEGWLKDTLSAHVAIPSVGGEPPTLVGVGGTVVNLAGVKLGKSHGDHEALHGQSLTTAEIGEQIRLFQSVATPDRARIPGLASRRADIIVAGAAIVRAVVHHVGAERIYVSTRGLRHGVMYDRFVSQAQAET